MIEYYFDENIDGPVARGLRRRGINVLTAQDDGHRQTDDRVSLDRALSLSRVMFSQDEDMVLEAVRRQRTGESFAGLVFAPIRLPFRKYIDDLELIASVMTLAELTNMIIYLPL